MILEMVKEQMSKRGMGPGKLIRLSGVNKNTVGRVLRGNCTQISVESLDRILKAVGLEVRSINYRYEELEESEREQEKRDVVRDAANRIYAEVTSRLDGSGETKKWTGGPTRIWGAESDERLRIVRATCAEILKNLGNHPG